MVCFKQGRFALTKNAQRSILYKLHNLVKYNPMGLVKKCSIEKCLSRATYYPAMSLRRDENDSERTFLKMLNSCVCGKHMLSITWPDLIDKKTWCLVKDFHYKITGEYPHKKSSSLLWGKLENLTERKNEIH